MTSRQTASVPVRSRARTDSLPRKVVNLDNYAPAYFTWIANKLGHGASKAYRDVFAVGIETWRLLVQLAIEPSLTAQSISRTIGMDKASVSRTLKSMQKARLVSVGLDADDGRYRIVSITPKGRELHDGILSIALERERALLSVLTRKEQEVLLSMLRRLHENLPTVEERTENYVETHFPQPRRRRTRSAAAGVLRSASKVGSRGEFKPSEI